jgi:uncharacterized protein (TIGR03083 family)
MTTSQNAPAAPDWVSALQRERSTMLAFCDELTPTEWSTPSAASGWTVKDVVAHIGSGCHAMFGPALISLMNSSDIERTNDTFVDDRRDWPATRVLDEYRTWSGRVLTMAKVVCRTPLRAVPMPLGELGSFSTRLLLCGAMTFDHHTHLRHDIAPALDRPAPPTDAGRMAVVLAWMVAVLGNQLRNARLGWMDRPVGITLDGPGGGSWVADRGGVEAAGVRSSGTWIKARTIDFPEWATRRAHWSERDVRIEGDQGYGAAFLDFVNVV